MDAKLKSQYTWFYISALVHSRMLKLSMFVCLKSVKHLMNHFRHVQYGNVGVIFFAILRSFMFQCMMLYNSAFHVQKRICFFLMKIFLCIYFSVYICFYKGMFVCMQVCSVCVLCIYAIY